MKTINIGIDLSTTKIGVAICVFNENIFTIQETQEYILPVWGIEIRDYANMNYEIFKIISDIKKLIEKYSHNPYFPEFKPEDCSVNVGIELSNFSNPKLTQRFSRLAGIFQCYMISNANRFNLDTLKFFNANEWFYHFAKKYNISNFTALKREERKKLSIEKYNEFTNSNTDNDNKSDSFWIAYFLQKCNTTEISEMINDKKVELQRKISKAKRKIKELAKETGKPKMKEMWKSKLETWTNMLEEMERK